MLPKINMHSEIIWEDKSFFGNNSSSLFSKSTGYLYFMEKLNIIKYDLESHEKFSYKLDDSNKYSEIEDKPLFFFYSDSQKNFFAVEDIETRKYIIRLDHHMKNPFYQCKENDVFSINPAKSLIAFSIDKNNFVVMDSFENKIIFSTPFKDPIKIILFLNSFTIFIHTMNESDSEKQFYIVDLQSKKITDVKLGTFDSNSKFNAIANENEMYNGIYSDQNILLFNKWTHQPVFSELHPMNPLNKSLNSVWWYPYYPNSLLLLYSEGNALIYHVPSANIIRAYDFPDIEIKDAFYNTEQNVLHIITHKKIIYSIQIESILEFNGTLYRFTSLSEIIGQAPTNVIFEKRDDPEKTRKIMAPATVPSKNTLHQYGGFVEDKDKCSYEKSISLQFLENLASLYFDFKEKGGSNLCFHHNILPKFKEYKLKLNPTFNIDEFTIICLFLRNPVLISKLLE